MKMLIIVCVVVMLLVVACGPRQAKTASAPSAAAPPLAGNEVSSASEMDKELATDDTNAAANDLGQVTW